MSYTQALPNNAVAPSVKDAAYQVRRRLSTVSGPAYEKVRRYSKAFAAGHVKCQITPEER
jgi:hypothetical protein